MTDREKLELAAKALGKCLHKHIRFSYGNWGTDRDCITCGADVYGFSWKPDTDQADSDRMACDLVIGQSWFDGGVACFTQVGRINRVVSHDNTIEGRRAAVREARMLVAVEIGRAYK